MIVPTNAQTADATLTTKSITANGTYNASSDGADGYSSVDVDVYNPFEYIEVDLSTGAFKNMTMPDGTIVHFRRYIRNSGDQAYIFNLCRCDDLTLIFDVPPIGCAYLFCGLIGKKITLIADTSRSITYQSFLRNITFKELNATIDFSSVVAGSNMGMWLSNITLTYGRVTINGFVPNSLSVTPLFNNDVFDDSTKISFANALNESVTGQSIGNTLANIDGIRGNSVLDETETYHLFVEDENGEMTLQDFVTNVKGWTLT